MAGPHLPHSTNRLHQPDEPPVSVLVSPPDMSRHGLLRAASMPGTSNRKPDSATPQRAEDGHGGADSGRDATPISTHRPGRAQGERFKGRTLVDDASPGQAEPNQTKALGQVLGAG